MPFDMVECVHSPHPILPLKTEVETFTRSSYGIPTDIVSPKYLSVTEWLNHHFML